MVLVLVLILVALVLVSWPRRPLVFRARLQLLCSTPPPLLVEATVDQVLASNFGVARPAVALDAGLERNDVVKPI